MRSSRTSDFLRALRTWLFGCILTSTDGPEFVTVPAQYAAVQDWSMWQELINARITNEVVATQLTRPVDWSLAHLVVSRKGQLAPLSLHLEHASR